MGVDEVLGHAKAFLDTLGLTGFVLAFGVVAMVGAVIAMFFNRS